MAHVGRDATASPTGGLSLCLPQHSHVVRGASKRHVRCWDLHKAQEGRCVGCSLRCLTHPLLSPGPGVMKVKVDGYNQVTITYSVSFQAPSVTSAGPGDSHCSALYLCSCSSCTEEVTSSTNSRTGPGVT